jgi:hypothetical protein
MLNHIVLYKRKPDIPKRPELERSLMQCVHELGATVPGVRGWKVSANEVRRPISWDYVLESRFDDVRSLNSCLQHPAYIALISILTTYFEWAACDYTF